MMTRVSEITLDPAVMKMESRTERCWFFITIELPYQLWSGFCIYLFIYLFLLSVFLHGKLVLLYLGHHLCVLGVGSNASLFLLLK